MNNIEIIVIGAILASYTIIDVIVRRFFEKRMLKINQEFESEMKNCEDRINASFRNITETLKEYLNDR